MNPHPPVQPPNIVDIERLAGAARPWLRLVVAAAFGLLIAVTGMGDGVEQLLRGGRASIRRHSASSEIIVVEIDARSLARINQWPWPRRLYAQAVDRLSGAGVRTIAFDIDFSTTSNGRDDQIFADALRRAGGGVILPTFRQPAGHGSREWIDSLPIKPLRDVSFVAAVNIFPDPDGAIRSYPLGVVTRGIPRPNIAAMLVERGTSANDAFALDLATDPDTISRISFVDLIEGRIDPARLKGKRALIGGTAIELGDRYAVPGWGITPGVVIEALAADMLLRHGVPYDLGYLPALLVVILGLAASARRRRRYRMLTITGLTATSMTMPLVAEMLGGTLEIVPGLAALASMLVAELAYAVHHDLARRKFVDADTSLPNTAALAARASGRKDVNIQVARIDNFAEIAAGWGSRAGASLIVQMAERAALMLGTEIYRLENGAIGWLADTLSAEEEDGHFFSLSSVMRAAVHINGAPLVVHPTFGTAQGSADRIAQHIAGAISAAKRARANGTRWTRFLAGDVEEQRWQLSLLGEMSDAIASGAMWVAYQPKYSVVHQGIIGAEALVRWKHPERGAIPPDSFIPLIEAEGRAMELTRFVLNRALRDSAIWRENGHDLSVAVNLSACTLLDPDLLDMVQKALDHHGSIAGKLTLELTESAIISDPERAAERLNELKALGLGLSIDDYGTGQSTLSYLKQVPATELKIDKSFVRNLAMGGSDLLLVRSTIELAHALDMSVVAEGVEDEQCFQVLEKLDCDIVQGWLTGKPMPADEFVLAVAGGARRAA